MRRSRSLCFAVAFVCCIGSAAAQSRPDVYVPPTPSVSELSALSVPELVSRWNAATDLAQMEARHPLDQLRYTGLVGAYRDELKRRGTSGSSLAAYGLGQTYETEGRRMLEVVKPMVARKTITPDEAAMFFNGPFAEARQWYAFAIERPPIIPMAHDALAQLQAEGLGGPKSLFAATEHWEQAALQLSKDGFRDRALAILDRMLAAGVDKEVVQRLYLRLRTGSEVKQ